MGCQPRCPGLQGTPTEHSFGPLSSHRHTDEASAQLDERSEDHDITAPWSSISSASRIFLARRMHKATKATRVTSAIAATVAQSGKPPPPLRRPGAALIFGNLSPSLHRLHGTSSLAMPSKVTRSDIHHAEYDLGGFCISGMTGGSGGSSTSPVETRNDGPQNPTPVHLLSSTVYHPAYSVPDGSTKLA